MQFRLMALALAALAAAWSAAGCAATESPPPTPLSATETPTATLTPELASALVSAPTPKPLYPLSIAAMRQRQYLGSDLAIEQTLAPGSGYNRYIASYRWDGLKILGLLTVPRGAKPSRGFPAILFNHGFIPPAEYRTTERYVAYVDAMAKSGYIVFKSDLRGHGSSEGIAAGAYAAPDYTVDVLNALASLKEYKDADPQRIGMWGHSMGGQLTLRSLVIAPEIKAAVIWAGVTTPYTGEFNWRPPSANSEPAPGARSWRNELIQEYGSPSENPEFWSSISPNSFLPDLHAPIQLHHATGDQSVAYQVSVDFAHELAQANRVYEFYSYAGDDHNISKNFSLAMQRSIAFFDKYVNGK